jgi:sugar phosphate isomerase/epimerase
MGREAAYARGMSLPHIALSVIGDEVGASLDEMISFAEENDLSRLDMRTVDGRNLLGMSLEEVRDIAYTLHDADIEVPCFVSPVLKWAAPGKAAAGGKVDFAFDPRTCPTGDPIGHAFDIANVLGAPRLRVFSHLRYPGFAAHDIEIAVGRLAALGAHHDVFVEMENEPVCNVGSVAELAAFFRDLSDVPDYLRPLVDIGNSWSMGEPPKADDIQLLAPHVDLIHIKDRDLTAKRGVPVGDGGVPWAMELKRLLQGVTAEEVVASLETHCPQDGRNATARSVANLRRIAGEIGAELV